MAPPACMADLTRVTGEYPAWTRGPPARTFSAGNGLDAGCGPQAALQLGPVAKGVD
jgi:hypothetical protein